MAEDSDHVIGNGAIDDEEHFIDDDNASDEGGLFGSGSEDDASGFVETPPLLNSAGLNL